MMLRSLIESGKIWVVAVVGLLMLNVSVCAVTVIAATSNPVAAAVEPDYYQKAVDWDKTRASWPSPDRIGWTVTLIDRGSGHVEVQTTAAGSGAVRLTGGRFKARHAGATLEVREGELVHDASGRLMWNAEALSPGLWTITVRLQGDGEQVMETQRLMIGG